MFIVSAFDLYIIATEAIRNNQLHAGVVFATHLVKRMKKDRNVVADMFLFSRALIFTFQFAKNVLKKAKKMHDLEFIKVIKGGKYKGGNIREISDLNSHPFDPSLQNNGSNASIQDFNPILDRDSLYLFKRDHRHTRRAIGRRQWNQLTELTELDKLRYDLETSKQSRILCRGGQLRVTICLFLFW